MPPVKRVVVWHPVGDPQQMPFLRGISEYARQRGSWVLHVNPEMFSLKLRDLTTWPGDGVIAALRTKAELSAARALNMPVVNLAGAFRQTGLPRVMVDQAAMGRVAAEHLIGRGLSRFAFFGEREMWYSQQRKDGFASHLAENGYSCAAYDSTTKFGRRNPWYKWMEPIEHWLQTLDPPVGLLAVHDYAATMLVEACLRIGRRVPDDVAVVGIGNDTITCEFSPVPLSSVARNNRQVGYEAAALLDRLMAGQAPPKGDVLIQPEGVVARRSTDLLVVADRHVKAAVSYIHEHAAERICVETLCGHLGISHRLLDLRFRKHMNCSPREFLGQVRVERAKQMLSAHDNPKLQHVAKACGFSSERHLRAAFKRLTGLTPFEFRRTS